METSQETRREIPDIQFKQEMPEKEEQKKKKKLRLIQKNNRTANRKEKQSEIERSR